MNKIDFIDRKIVIFLRKCIWYMYTYEKKMRCCLLFFCMYQREFNSGNEIIYGEKMEKSFLIL